MRVDPRFEEALAEEIERKKNLEVSESNLYAGSIALLAEIENILSGIDKTEVESSNGWWETSTGAEYGAGKLDRIRNLFKQ